MKRFALLLIIALVLAACAGMQLKNPAEMTPQERSYFSMKLYNNAFANYNVQFASAPAPMSVEMGDYFRTYKRVMEVAWPTITVYKTVTMSGGVPTIAQEQEILKVIYLLQALIMREVQNG